MIKVKITHLKAPWPKGAQVGDVVALPSMRPWALGKCVRVEDDEEAAYTVAERPEAGETVEAVMVRAQAHFQRMDSEHQQHVSELIASHAKVVKDLQAEHQTAFAVLQAKLDHAGADARAMRSKLDEAEAALAAATKPAEGKVKAAAK